MKKPIVSTTKGSPILEFEKRVFERLKNTDCVTAMFSAGGGKRTIIKNLLREQTAIKAIFGQQYEKTLFVYIDSDEVLDSTAHAYLQLMRRNLRKSITEKKIKIVKNKETNSLAALKENLKQLTDANWTVIFILNDFEFTLSLSTNIYLNLETIMSVNKSKITYLFLPTVNILRTDILAKLHNLKYAVTQNIVYFSLFPKEEIFTELTTLSKKAGIKLTPKLFEIFFNLCGGHPQLIKYSFYIYLDNIKSLTSDEQLEKFLINHHQLKIVCSDIEQHLSDEEKSILINTVITGKLLTPKNHSFEYLVNLGLLQTDKNGDLKVFGKIFEEFIKSKLPPRKLVYDQNANKLYYGSRSCDRLFTHQEFKLLCYFVTHENEVISRDQVGETLWGKNYVEKFSDWSIDKLISNIRKKLDELGFPSQNLSTLKKRGFNFTNS